MVDSNYNLYYTTKNGDQFVIKQAGNSFNYPYGTIQENQGYIYIITSSDLTGYRIYKYQNQTLISTQESETENIFPAEPPAKIFNEDKTLYVNPEESNVIYNQDGTVKATLDDFGFQGGKYSPIIVAILNDKVIFKCNNYLGYYNLNNTEKPVQMVVCYGSEFVEIDDIMAIKIYENYFSYSIYIIK